jgi:hypothetical protein
MTIFVSVGHMALANCISLDQEQEQEKEENQLSYVNYTSYKFKAVLEDICTVLGASFQCLFHLKKGS